MAPTSTKRSQAAANRRDERVAAEVDQDEDEPDQQCRVCTIRSDCFSYFNIYDKLIFKNVAIADALGMVTNLELSPEDALPQTICCRCEQRLLDAYHFRKLAESSARSFAKLAPPKSPAAIDQKQAASPASSKTDDDAAAAKKATLTARMQLIRTVKKLSTRSRSIKTEPTAAVSLVADDFEQFAAEQLLEPIHQDDDGGEDEDHNSSNHTESNDTAILDSSVTLEEGEHSNSFKIVYDQEPALQRKTVTLPANSKKTKIAAEESADDDETVADEQSNEDYEDDDEDGVSFLITHLEPEQKSDVKKSEPKTATKRPRESVDTNAAKKTPTTAKKPKSSAEKKTSPRNAIVKAEAKSPAKRSPIKTAATILMTSPIKTPPSSSTKKPAQVNNNDGSPDANVSEEYMRRKHVCEVCNKRFVGRSNLVDHLRHHANVRPFQCEHCDKTFVQKGSLVCHLRTHTREKPFKCEVCPKSFSQASSRQIHQRQHTQMRSYKCSKCPAAFYSNSDLVKHIRIHDDIKMFQCTVCPYNFAQRSNLKKHVEKKHPELVNA